MFSFLLYLPLPSYPSTLSYMFWSFLIPLYLRKYCNLLYIYLFYTWEVVKNFPTQWWAQPKKQYKTTCGTPLAKLFTRMTSTWMSSSHLSFSTFATASLIAFKLWLLMDWEYQIVPIALVDSPFPKNVDACFSSSMIWRSYQVLFMSHFRCASWCFFANVFTWSVVCKLLL